MQHIYYFEHGQFIAPTHHMITIYNKLYSEYDIDFDDFRKLPFDIILTILSFIKFPEIIFYSKKLIETAHYSDLYEKMLLYDVMAKDNSQQQHDFRVDNFNGDIENGQLDRNMRKSIHKRTNSNSLTKTIPFNINNLISKLFGVFEKERNQRVFLFDFYSHLKFIGFDQMLNLYNSFYRFDSFAKNDSEMTLQSPRSSMRRSKMSNDDDFLNLLTSSPHSFEKFLANKNDSEIMLESFEKRTNLISIHSNLPRHLRNCVHTINSSLSRSSSLNNISSEQSIRRRSKSLGSSQIAIQVRKKILENEEQDELVDESSRKRFSIQFYNVRNFFYIPYLESVTFSNCSNQANYYINFVVIPFFRFNNHLKSFKLIDCQLSQESVRELYFQLRAMFIQMHKSGQSSSPCYASLRELSLADNELLHCSWNFIFPNLRILDLSGNRSLIEPSLCKLLAKDIENFKYLKRLNLSNGCFDGNMTVKNNTLEELDVFDIRVPLNTVQLENQIIKHCKRIKLIKYYSAQEKKLVKWIRSSDE
ncbi:predicted protein [Naegleria gruberi]|uniref:Predicted protein n=1 Tax=Naegleria gruberi TaxID=5762 RepID=D2V2U8_NAEGR|nr:uncharacterized protein NAEGRDRAFT_63124 [Naegleria gruberi]EFC49122.1 predicted protein [Naegleria gruberi]|eukprot:XP_002681866.1 predicted protein [Naegleria gruberi strain NEG-M]